MANGSLAPEDTNRADIEILQQDLERIVRQLNSAQEKNAALEKELESNEILKVMVAQLQDQVSRLQEERAAYLTKQRSQQPNHF